MNVVVVTPNAADGALAAGFLEEHGIEARCCATLADLIPMLGGDTGCVVLVEEALADPDLDSFHAALRAQPPWSDLPAPLRGAGSALGACRLFPHLGQRCHVCNARSTR